MAHAIKELEEAVIGTFLTDPGRFETAKGHLGPNFHFSDVRFQSIYDTLIDLTLKGTTWDLVFAANECMKDDKRVTYTLCGQLTENKLISDQSLFKACDTLRDASETSLLKARLTEARSILDEPSIPAYAAAEKIRSLFTLQTATADDLVSLKSLATQYAKDARNPQREIAPTLETRIAGLNKLITGFYPEEYVLIAAPPSFGKTALAFDTAMFNCWYERNTLYFALDQSTSSMVHRLYASRLGISKERFHAANKSEEELKAIENVTNDVQRWKGEIIISDYPNLTIGQLKATARRLAQTMPLHLIVVDYVQQLTPDGSESRYQFISNASRDLKALARELKCTIFVVSQFNRSWDEGECNPAKEIWPRPRLSMLRDSGALEQDANTAVFVYRYLKVLEARFGQDSQQYQDELSRCENGIERAEIYVAKQKEGQTGLVRCHFNGNRMQYYSIIDQNR